MTAKITRNTPTSYRCRECNGDGIVSVGIGSFREYDREVGCPCCSGEGWIITAPHDPLSGLKWLRSFGPAFPFYVETRRAAFAPVRLP